MNFFKSLSIYTLSNAANSGISLLLLPVFTNYLTPADFGILALFTIGISLLQPLIGMAVNGAVQVEYFKLDEKQFRSYVSSALFNNVLVFSFIILILFFAGEFIESTFQMPLHWLWIIPFITLFQIISQLVLSLFQIKNQPWAYISFSLSQALINMLGGLLFVIVLHMNWKGRLLNLFITYFLFFLVSVYILYKNNYLSFNIDKKYSYSAFYFGLPLIPHAIAAFIIDSSDRIFITKMVGISELGIYNVGYQIAMIIGLLEVSFNLAFSPFLFERLKEDTLESKKQVVRLSYLFIALLLLAVILLYFLTPLIFYIFIGNKFAGGSHFVFWIALSYFFSGVYKVFVGYIFYLKKTIILTYLALVNITLNLILNYILIGIYGTIGAAYATCISFAVVALLIIIISSRIYKMPWLLYKD